MNSNVILSIDDNPANQSLIRQSLQDQYSVLLADSGPQGLNVLQQNPNIDVILLDVDMPEMTGYEVCQQLKQDVDLADIPVIFISAMSSIEDRLKGYAAGGEDYLVKPIDIKELKKKIERSLNHRAELQQMKEQLQFATNTAMTSMMQSGELGVVLEYLINCHHCQNAQELSDLTLSVLQQFSLKAAIQLRLPTETINAASHEAPLSPMEEELLSRGAQGDRIITFGNRCMFNARAVSFLIKNMPDDDDFSGRLRDHLAQLLKGIEARTQYFELQHQIQQQQRHSVVQQLDRFKEQFQTMAHRFYQMDQQTDALVNELQSELHETLMSFGLTDSQENEVLALLDHTKEELKKITDFTIELETEFNQLTASIFDHLSH